jgi:hypothetical protein
VLGSDRGIVKHRQMAPTQALNDSGAGTNATVSMSNLTAIRILAILFASGTVAGPLVSI